MSDQGEGDAALTIYDEIRPQIERNDPNRLMVYWSYHAQALMGVRRLDEASISARKAVELTLAIPGQGMTAFLNAAEIMEARHDAQGIADLSEKFETYFAGRATPSLRITRLEIAAITDLCEDRPAASAFDRVAQAYEEVGAGIRTLYRRATAAALRSLDASQGARASRELRVLREQLVSHGALRYVRALDALRDGGPPGSWIVGPAALEPEVTRAN
jgi:hypothetical protein